MVRLKCGRSWVPSRSRLKPKTTKLVFVAYLLTTKHSRVTSTTKVGSESGKCAGVERHVYTQTVVSSFTFLISLGFVGGLIEPLVM